MILVLIVVVFLIGAVKCSFPLKGRHPGYWGKT
jgi:hypothetical protein